MTRIQTKDFETATWQERLDSVVETMREMSQQTDPQEMVRNYGTRMRRFFPADRFLAISRRDLAHPQVKVTRYSEWETEIDPWKNSDRLPILEGGLLADLIYGNKPVVIEDFELSPDDPAYEYLGGQRSLRAVPLFDQGESLNMVIATKSVTNGFSPEDLPEVVWISNLFGRATHNLVLADRLNDAYEAIDKQLKIVGEIQHDLLPAELPEIPRMELATHYKASERAGGDYYDFFPLSGGRWGMLIADVSGHGTPAAVVMAMTRSIAHTFDHANHGASELLSYINKHLADQYTSKSGAFVTAFYGIYDPSRKTFNYASAGHNPPRLKRCSTGQVLALDKAGRLPMGITPDITYDEHTDYLQAFDRLVIYTDGIVEAMNPDGELFGLDRMDAVLADCDNRGPQKILEAVLDAVDQFAAGSPQADDRTMIVAELK